MKRRVFFEPDARDLEILGVSAETFARRLVLSATGGLVSALLLGVAALTAGIIAGAYVVVIGAAVTGVGAGGWRLTSLRRKAEQARADADLAVSAYLDLITILLAGGAGLETALISAAGCGDGWAFSHIRAALVRAQSARANYWDELRDWGRGIGVESIVEVAHSVQIAGEHGARIRASLVAKSKSLRARNIARIEHDASRRTEQMGLPIVAMFLGFVIFVSYPALMGTIGQF